jgi:SagB-type dehydrogenase family enzyme
MLNVKTLRKKLGRSQVENAGAIIDLPKPRYFGDHSIEEVLLKRRSVRSYKDEPLQLQDVSQLLWAAQGITGTEGERTAPSAGALYPLSIYLGAANINGLPAAIYRYDPTNHTLIQIAEGDTRKKLCAAALMQGAVRHCAAILIFAADYRHVVMKYFDKAKGYVHMEVGHAAQNVFLQAVSLGIGTVTMGAFLNGPVKKILHLPKHEEALYLMPLGKVEN